jgi:hypothetical protein
MVAHDDGDAHHLHGRAEQRQEQRHGVVHAGIAVDQHFGHVGLPLAWSISRGLQYTNQAVFQTSQNRRPILFPAAF